MFSLLTQIDQTDITGYILTAILFLLIIAATIWWKTRCVRCQRPFAKRTLRKEKRGRGILDTVTGTRQEFYECKYCDHKWDKVVTLD